MAYMENKIDELLANNGVRRIKRKKARLRACNIHIMATNIIFRKIITKMKIWQMEKSRRHHEINIIHGERRHSQRRDKK